MMLAIKIIATIALTFALIVFGITSIMTKNSEDTKKAVKYTLIACSLAQVLGILVIWLGA